MGLDEAEKMKDEDPCWDTHQMVGMKMKNGRKVPNCVPKAKAKNEEVETVEEASDTKRPPNFTMHPIDRQDYKILRPSKKAPPKDSKEWGRDGGEKKLKEETEQIDELNKDTVYSYNKKADADIEKKHKSLGQLMRKGDAAGANKAAHQLNKRVAGMERAEKRLNKEEVEIEEAKKTTPNAKPVDPKNLVVSLKDVPVKKPRGHTQYNPAKEFPGVKALKREEIELEEGEGIVTPKNKLPFTDPPKGSYAWDVRYGNITKKGSYRKKPNPNKPPVKEDIEIDEEEVKKAKMTPQERAYKRKLGLKAVVGTVQEAVKAMKNKKGDPSQSKNVKKGEPLSGKQEPVKLNPELQEK